MWVVINATIWERQAVCDAVRGADNEIANRRKRRPETAIAYRQRMMRATACPTTCNANCANGRPGSPMRSIRAQYLLGIPIFRDK